MIALYTHSQQMTSIAQMRASNMSVPSQSYYLINRVEKLENFYPNKIF